MAVELRADTRLGMDEDDREWDLTVLRADELVGVLGVVEVVELDDRASRLRQGCLPSSIARRSGQRASAS
jgi:hypothetical protein